MEYQLKWQIKLTQGYKKVRNAGLRELWKLLS